MFFKELFLKKYMEKDKSTNKETAPPPVAKDTKIISVINQKGGCGKTTTIVNLSACLAEKGYKVLVIDLDPQAHASLGLGIKVEELDRHIYHVLKSSEYHLSDVTHDTYTDLLKVVPTNTLLASSLIDFVNNIGREGLLKEHTDKCKGEYDFIFVDCPPSLNLLTVNALTASTSILVPIQTHYYSLEGMKELFKTIDQVKNRLNPNLEVCGILATLFDRRTKVGRMMLDALKEYFKEKMFNTVIHINSALSEAPIYGKPITQYNPKAKGAEDYRQLAEEILIKYERGQKEGRIQSGILDVQVGRVEEPAEAI